jgi:putative methyltransferase (TIGR04325 family)
MKLLKKIFTKFLRKAPIVSDYYDYHRRFYRETTACRGVFETYAEALQAVPKSLQAGYSQPEIRNHSSVGKLTSAWEPGEFNPMDYPILVWLTSAFSDGPTIFDFGGNVGQAYYAYQKFLHYPEGLRWVVCELPIIIEAGEKIAIEKNAKNLAFTTDFTDADGVEILLTSGTLQYLESSLADFLGKLKVKPPHIIINQVPLYNGETFFTLQNIGYSVCPYKIQNKTELINSLAAMNYKLIDSWENYRSCRIPFHPERFVSAYYGFCFKLIQYEPDFDGAIRRSLIRENG